MFNENHNIDQVEDGTDVTLDFWDKKVLFVLPGHGGTYSVICKGIIAGLKKLVREIYITNAKQDVARFATQIKADLVLVLLGDTLPIHQRNAIAATGIKSAVWFTEDPYYTDVTSTIAPFYHYVFTQEASCVSFYKKMGCPRVYHLPLAVNTKYFHKQRQIDSFIIDVCFMGTAWNNRISLFDKISPYLSTKKALIVGPNWNQMQNYRMLSSKIRLEVLSPEESAHLINWSKIVINNHRSHDDDTFSRKNSNQLPAFSINHRTFEISACGAFQLSDIRPELPQYYELGKEIETYSSPSELIQKIDYYLSHDDERNAIAQRGHIKTLMNHTYLKRLVTLLKVVFG